MSSHWASASAVERVVACAASSALPQLRESGPAANKGNKVHEELEEACGPGDGPVSVGGFLVNRVDLALPAGSLPEQAFSWDAVTGTAAGYGKLPKAREYPDAPYSTLYGTADVYARLKIELSGKSVPAVFIGDYKSGHFSFLPESDSWQMRVLVMKAAKVAGVGYGISRITSVRDGLVNHKPQKLWTPEELAETEVILRRTYDAVNARARKGVTVSDVSVGSHCHWCPAWRSCPANQLLLRNVPGDVDERDTAAAFAVWQQLKTAAGKFEDTFKRISSADPVHVGGNYVYGVASDGKFRKFRR